MVLAYPIGTTVSGLCVYQDTRVCVCIRVQMEY